MAGMLCILDLIIEVILQMCLSNPQQDSVRYSQRSIKNMCKSYFWHSQILSRNNRLSRKKV